MIPVLSWQYGISMRLPIIIAIMSLVFLGIMVPSLKKYDEKNVLRIRKFGEFYMISFQLLVVLSSAQLLIFK
jgi:hypothetical protein